MVGKIATGELKQITTYVDAETFDKIEAARGVYSKSSFVATILMDVFSDVPVKQEA